MAEIISDVRLLYVDLNNDYKHTLYFNDRVAQESYFLGVKKFKDLNDYSYQRKDSKLRVNLSLDEALKYNYVMYHNYNYTTKRYYAFITDYEWNNDRCTTLTLETDVMQTYLPDYDIAIMPSFVEREHTSDDTIGANTIPENLEMGEYQVKYSSKINELIEPAIIVAATEPPDKNPNTNESGYYTGEEATLAKLYATPGLYNGIYSGLCYYRFDTVNPTILNTFLKGYSDSGSVKSIFMYPLSVIEQESLLEFVKKSDYPTVINYEINKAYFYNRNTPADYWGNEYNPRNKKLLTYPYIYLLVSNNNGGSAIYQYEHFVLSTGGNITFKVECCLTPGGSIRLIPKAYKGMPENHEEGLNLGKYPICNWTSDEFTNWLTQNSVNIGLNLASGLGQIALGVGGAIATGGVGAVIGSGSAMGGVSTIVNQLTQIHQMSFTPPQSNGNINCGDVITASGENTFTFHHMTIKPEYMKVIDEFFDVYGYRCNRIKIPEFDHRERWWYTKTVDVNILGYGDIPTADLNKIKACYNNGITFWRNASEIGNYNLSNEII